METVERNLFVAMAALSLLLVGCGKPTPDLHEVQGIVTYQGKPLPLGRVSFISDSYRPISSLIDPNGRYALKTVAGQHKIEVVANEYIQSDKTKKSMDVNLGETKPLIPGKFNRYQTSGIAVKVDAKPLNEIDIELK